VLRRPTQTIALQFPTSFAESDARWQSGSAEENRRIGEVTPVLDSIATAICSGEWAVTPGKSLGWHVHEWNTIA